MAAATSQEIAPGLLAAEEGKKARAGRRRKVEPDVRRRRLESTAIFLLFTAVYFALGARVSVDFHALPGDGLSRMAHAYFAFYNDPPKLAAVGFEWPPLDTLALLPFAVIKPLATSLYALPLSSAVTGGLLMVALNRTLGMCEMRAWFRYPLLVAFGANPMIAYYASNGMSEILSILLLVVGVHLFLRWRLNGEDHVLILCGVALACAFLSRFELLAWTVPVGLAVWYVLRRARAGPERIEGSLLAYAGPVLFGVTVWCLYNWLIVGSPLYWLEIQTAANLGASESALASAGPLKLAGETLQVTTEVFLLVPLTTVALVLLGAIRRDSTAVILALLVALNAISTFGLLLISGSEDLLRLRYNMRTMGLAIVAIGWLYFIARGRIPRMAVWVASLAALLVAIPLSADTMRRGLGTYYEDAFIRAVEGGGDQEEFIKRTTPNGSSSDRALARFIETRLPHGKSRIMVDDGQLFAVILLTGHPDWFLDRVDRGDTVFRDVLRHPYKRVNGRYKRRVDYVIVSRIVDYFDPDLVRRAYPGAAAGKVPWLDPIYTKDFYTVLEVANPYTMPEPLRRQLADLPPLPRRARPPAATTTQPRARSATTTGSGSP